MKEGEDPLLIKSTVQATGLCACVEALSLLFLPTTQDRVKWQHSPEINMANNAPWPPVALDYLNKLLPDQKAFAIHPLFDESGRFPYPPTAFSDQDLEQARRDNGNDPRIDHWAPGDQMRWLMRQPLRERHYYVRDTPKANSSLCCSHCSAGI